MSDSINDKFKNLEAEYARLLKCFSDFDKIKKKFFSDRGESFNDEIHSMEKKVISLDPRHVARIADNAKKDLKVLRTSLKKLEAHIKHGVDKYSERE